MKSFLHLFDNTTWLNLVFFVLTIVGLFLTFYFYYKSKREKKPVFGRKTFTLVQPNLSALKNLEIKYNNKNVESLSLTKFAFWNLGRESIRKEDIVERSPLLLTALPEVTIYDIEISYQNTVNGFKVEKISDQSVCISFDYLDYNDGIVLNVYHSGNKSSDITFTGTLIGANKIIMGVKKDVLLNKLDFVFRPSNYLINKKEPVMKALALILAAITITLFFPIFIVLLVLDFIYEKTQNKYRKEFFLFDESPSKRK